MPNLSDITRADLAVMQQAYDNRVPDESSANDTWYVAAEEFEQTGPDFRAWLNDSESIDPARDALFAAIAWYVSADEQRGLDLNAAIERLGAAYIARCVADAETV